MKIPFLLLLVLQTTLVHAQSKKTEIFILSTIHGAHKLNPHYTYDTLFLEKQNQDVLAVEIRQEDIDSSIAYLKDNYPYEMYTCIKQFPETPIFGIDWLGEELEGKSIPENYWSQSSEIKTLQRQLNQDSLML